MIIQIEQLRRQTRMENRKFFIRAIIGIAAVFGVGIAIGYFLLPG